MEERTPLFCVGILNVLDGSKGSRRTEPFSTIAEARDALYEMIDGDDDLQVALVGEPRGGGSWKAGLRYIISGEYSDGQLKAVEWGHVLPKGDDPRGINFRSKKGYVELRELR